MAGDPPADFGMKILAAFQKSMSFATFNRLRTWRLVGELARNSASPARAPQP
jgi:hypothetical protein